MSKIIMKVFFVYLHYFSFLAYAVAPGAPLDLSVDDFGATWANLCWQRPSNMGQPGIAKYVVVSTPVSGGPEETFISTLTRLNVTGLLPNVEYVFRVQAVAVALEVKNPSMLSEAVSITTETTGEVVATLFCCSCPSNQLLHSSCVYLALSYNSAVGASSSSSSPFSNFWRGRLENYISNYSVAWIALMDSYNSL